MSTRFPLLSLLSFVLLAAPAAATGCGAGGSDASPSAARGDGGATLGTPPPDGAPGVCCPASTGGCAKMGGYHADGQCPPHDEVCDNMCEQRIVTDDHGCSKLTYKSPPVATTFASTGSCSDPIFNGGGPSSPREGGAPVNPPPLCEYAPPNNPPLCPASFSYMSNGKSCPKVGLECWYPGAGDGTADGCNSTALMKCVGEGGIGDDDGGVDAGAGTWVTAQ